MLPMLPSSEKPSPRRATAVTFTLPALLRVLGVLALAVALWRLTELVLLVVTAAIVAAAIVPAARRLERHGVSRLWTVLGIFGALLAGLALLGALTAPVLGEQVSQLTTRAPEQVSRLNQWSAAKLSALVGHPVAAPDSGRSVQTFLTYAGGRALHLATGTAGAVGSLILVIVLAGFMVLDDRRFRAGFLRFIPPDARRFWAAQWDEVQERMGGYVAGMALISLEKGVVITLGLWLIGVPSAVLLGILAGVLNFIPYVGFWSVFVLAELLAFNAGATKGVWVFAFFMGHEWFKSGLLGPYLLGRTTKVHPAVVLVAIAAGAKLFGLIGTLVAAPVAAAASVVVGNLLPAPGDAAPASTPRPAPALRSEPRRQWRLRAPARGSGTRRGLI